MSGSSNYEERRAAKVERLRARAAKLEAAASASADGAFSILDRIPPGQPVLVGHHSERRHRRDLERADSGIRRLVELGRAAERAAARADAAEESRDIASDDPAAAEKLRLRIAELEAVQEVRKAKNAEWRRGGGEGEAPYPAWQLSNNSANIRRLRARLAEVERLAASAPADGEEAVTEYGPVVVRVDPAAGRVYIETPGRNEAATKVLRGAGWVWARSEGCWSRKWTANAVAAAAVVGPRLAEVYGAG